MTLWAIVPIKPLRRAKSRLSAVLSREERSNLSRDMLVHMLEVLGEVPAIECTLVVSRDTEALAIARDHGARTVSEWGTPDLNPALVRATIVAQQYGVSGVLVLPADLPLIASDDVEALIAKADRPPVVVIAPDRHGSGTNALLARPPGLIEYDFGPESFQRHLERAQQAGIRVEICTLPSLGLDVDLPEDLELLRKESDREIMKSIEEEIE